MKPTSKLIPWLGFFIASTLAAAERPNVLFITIDDLNNWVGYLDQHPQAHTPNLDRLVNKGVAFTEAHCTTPICKASRTAFLTGLSETKTGVYTNDDKFTPDGYTLLPQYFTAHGYTTYGAGKIHHMNINEKMFEHAYEPEQRWSPFSRKQSIYTAEELPSKGSANPRHLIANGPGGKDYTMPFNRMPSERSPEDPKGESFDWSAFDLPDSAFGDGQITDWAIERLSSHDPNQPFFLGLGYYRPHIPLYAPKAYFDLYPLDEIQLPEVMPNDLADIPDAGMRRIMEAAMGGAATHQHVISHDQWKQAVQAYLACISFIDAQVGRMLDYLEDSPFGSNTTIVLFSDHGWHLGEKQAWGKMTGWVHSTHTPLIIASDGMVAGQFCDEPVSLLDIYPTLIDLCDLPARQLDGVSLIPLLQDPSLETDRVVKTHIGKGTYSLSSKTWRYLHYASGEEELYDIKNDPREYGNLINRGDYSSVIEALKKNTR
ncbi:MAG: sulfatase [Synoicihabitans sp.]